MEKTFLIFQAFLAGVISWMANRLGILFPLLGILCLFMVIDYVTGMLASKAESIDHPGDPAYGWNSRKGAKGILKKVAYICVISVAIAADYIIIVLAEKIGISTHSGVFFALWVTVWYILNELLSILENAGRMGAGMPDWLVKNIAALKDKVDNEVGGDE